jgi:hypothetical protein
MGLRVPVGTDCRERRYWLLGGVAGAWRLYCEEKEGQLWVSDATLQALLLLLLLLLLLAAGRCGRMHAARPTQPVAQPPSTHVHHAQNLNPDCCSSSAGLL